MTSCQHHQAFLVLPRTHRSEPQQARRQTEASSRKPINHRNHPPPGQEPLEPPSGLSAPPRSPERQRAGPSSAIPRVVRLATLTPARQSYPSVREPAGSFVWTAEPSCLADFNADGFVDFFDYADFVACFQAEGCPEGRTADANQDGFIDFFDYADFVDAFETGC